MSDLNRIRELSGLPIINETDLTYTNTPLLNVVRIHSVFYKILLLIHTAGPMTDSQVSSSVQKSEYADRLAASGLLDKTFDPNARKGLKGKRGVSTYSLTPKGKKVLKTLQDGDDYIYSDVDGNPVRGPLLKQDLVTHPHLFNKDDYPHLIKKNKKNRAISDKR